MTVPEVVRVTSKPGEARGHFLGRESVGAKTEHPHENQRRQSSAQTAGKSGRRALSQGHTQWCDSPTGDREDQKSKCFLH